MPTEQISVRRMSRADVDIAVSWAAKEGWNPGLHDAECFYSADPNGFFIAEVDGKPAGCISAVVYDDRFGFLGFYIVRPDLRHHGIGLKLWDAAIDYMGDRTVGGDGVVAMLPKYEQCGFKIAHRNARYQGTGARSSVQLPDLVSVPFPELETYDRRFFPSARTEFLRKWISRPGSHGRAVLVNGGVAGYGVIRPCHTGFKIAPLFADSSEIAEQLFSALSSLAEGKPIFLDIPVCNDSAVALVERHAMTKVFETARIYKGPAPQLPLNNIYGITSFELG